MICENCKIDYEVMYGSGRFCSEKCARSFSTKIKRDEINKKVSEKLKGKNFYSDKKHELTTQQKSKGGLNGAKVRYKQLYEDLQNLSSEDLCEKYSIKNKKIIEKIFHEQNNCCGVCFIKDWNKKPIIFELHHIDGNNKNNSRCNLVFLCPNCHSQTDNYCFRNRKHSEESKEKLRNFYKAPLL